MNDGNSEMNQRQHLRSAAYMLGSEDTNETLVIATKSLAPESPNCRRILQRWPGLPLCLNLRIPSWVHEVAAAAYVYQEFKKNEKKRGCAIFPMMPVVQTHPDSFPTSYDQRLPGAHLRYTSHRQRVVWNNAVDELALCHQVYWVFIAFHRQCLNYCQVI